MRYVKSRLFNTLAFIFVQLSCSATNVPALTLPLNKLIVIYGF